MKLARPSKRIGCIQKTKDYVKIFASYDKDDDGFTFGDRTMIPRPWVKKITRL